MGNFIVNTKLQLQQTAKFVSGHIRAPAIFEATAITIDFDFQLDADICQAWSVGLLDENLQTLVSITHDQSCFGPGKGFEGNTFTVLGSTAQAFDPRETAPHHLRAELSKGKARLIQDGVVVIPELVYGDATTKIRVAFVQAGGWNPQFAPVGQWIDNILIQAVPPVIQVAINIKPGSDPNSINPKSKGVIPVAILTTDTFDATTVDPLSVKFGPAGATETHSKGHIEDADGDGDLDLVLHFKTKETGIQCGDTSASLTGNTFWWPGHHRNGCHSNGGVQLEQGRNQKPTMWLSKKSYKKPVIATRSVGGSNPPILSTKPGVCFVPRSVGVPRKVVFGLTLCQIFVKLTHQLSGRVEARM